MKSGLDWRLQPYVELCSKYKRDDDPSVISNHMSKITQIKRNNIVQRVSVYIDYHFCMSIREHIWQEMGLAEGSEISCAELKQKEHAVWKKLSKASALENSRQALLRVQHWFSQHLPNIDARIIDFRFGYADRPSSVNYPHTRTDQNISLLLKGTITEVMTLEVASMEIQRGLNYWVRADKIDYAQSQHNRDTWVVLYCKYPTEQLVWIKPLFDKQYKHEELIGNTKSLFVAFNDKSPEVHSSEDFCKYVQSKIDQMVKEIKF